MHRSQADTTENGDRRPGAGGRELGDRGPSTDLPSAADDAALVPELKRGTVLRLLVRNHPGVMSHVCGLFARRAFNVEGIVCLPVEDGTRSVVLLVVVEDARLEQVIRQLEKLEDVIEVRRAPEARQGIAAVAQWLR